MDKNYLIYLFNYLNIYKLLPKNYNWGLGIGDWGLGIGPNPQSPIPKPQTPNPQPPFKKIYIKIIS